MLITQGMAMIRVGVIVDEYFGACGTPYGGYGFLARHIVGRYLPCEDIHVDMLMGVTRNEFRHEQVDGIDVYWLPKRWKRAQWFLWRKNYDVYLGIELVHDDILRRDPRSNRKLVLWVQDPRPWSDWREIQTVKSYPEPCYYQQRIYDTVHEWHRQGRVRWVTQAHCLREKACDLYRLPGDQEMEYLPNPVEVDPGFDVTQFPKKNKVIFLGRIESVKRGWLFCELAALLPEYEFYMLGQSFREQERNAASIAHYGRIPNLHFVGHVEGEEKLCYLREAKVLVNTSIHEALPVSFLEAMSYGVCLVSNRNPDQYTERFGRWVGDVTGDGYDALPRFAEAVRGLMENEEEQCAKAMAARAHIERYHRIPDWVEHCRRIIREEAAKP